MSQTDLLSIMSMAMQAVIFTAAPPLLIGLAVGLVVSIFQTVTSIQEQTLAFIPKILAVLLSIVIFGPFMLNQLMDLFTTLLNNINVYLK